MAIATKIHSPVDIESRRTLGIKPGDTVRVYQKIEEKGKTRLQLFEGLVLACKHGNEPGATFTVRKISGGVGVEKIFPLYSPVIDKIEIVKRARVRRAKLYYIREKVAREIRRQMRNMRMVSISTESEVAKDEEKAPEDVEDSEAVPEGTSETEVKEEMKEGSGSGEAEVKEGDIPEEGPSQESSEAEEK